MAAGLTPAQRAVMLRIDDGPYHARSPRDLSRAQRAAARGLVLRGLLRDVPRTGRRGRRFVVTCAGSWALGTFDVVE